MKAPQNIAGKNADRLQIRPIHSASAHLPPDYSSDAECSLENVTFEDPELDPNCTHPIQYSLKKSKWSVVGTLTWKNSFRRRGSFDAEKYRRIDFKDLLKKACSKIKLRMKDIRFYHATEYGQAGECHFHFLLQNLKSEKVSNALLAETMQNFWVNYFIPFGSKQKAGGAGTAVITPYDASMGNKLACIGEFIAA